MLAYTGYKDEVLRPLKYFLGLKCGKSEGLHGNCNVGKYARDGHANDYLGFLRLIVF